MTTADWCMIGMAGIAVLQGAAANWFAAKFRESADDNKRLIDLAKLHCDRAESYKQMVEDAIANLEAVSSAMRPRERAGDEQ